MNFLLVFHDDQSPFDPDDIRRVFEDIPGTSELTTEGSRLRCHFDFNQDTTTAHLAEDLDAISIHCTGDASLQMALEIQRRYPQPLRVTDLDYGFDLLLSEIGSVEEFDKKIRDAYSTPDPASA
jgi:hypothetical protein